MVGLMIDFDFIEWDDPSDPRGNVQHIADNGVSVSEVEEVVYDPRNRPIVSRTSGRPLVVGVTSAGRPVVVVYERHKDAGYVVVRPVTAYELLED
jgi:hypothetical protein